MKLQSPAYYKQNAIHERKVNKEYKKLLSLPRPSDVRRENSNVIDRGFIELKPSKTQGALNVIRWILSIVSLILSIIAVMI